MVVLLAGVLMTACSQPSSVSAKPTVPVPSSTLAPTTTSTTYPVTSGSTLADVFRNDATTLMGAWPPDTETQAFITYYQSNEESCYQIRQSYSCPALASPDVDAREYLQINNQQAISNYHALIQQVMNDQSRVATQQATVQHYQNLLNTDRSQAQYASADCSAMQRQLQQDLDFKINPGMDLTYAQESCSKAQGLANTVQSDSLNLQTAQRSLQSAQDQLQQDEQG